MSIIGLIALWLGPLQTQNLALSVKEMAEIIGGRLVLRCGETHCEWNYQTGYFVCQSENCVLEYEP